MSETVFDNIDPAMMERIKGLRLFDDELMTVVFSGDKGDIAKRIRYHQAMIDSHTLKKQEDFEKLPNLYIIFILEHDLYGKNNPVYYVTKTLSINDEDGNPLLFDDGCNIMYVNGQYKGEDALGKLMHDFSTPNADEMYYKELAEKVRFYKQDETGVQMASRVVEEYGNERAAEALQQGLQQGAQQQAIEAAKNLLRMGLGTHEQIAQAQTLPLKKVQELAEEIAKEKD